MLGDVQIRGLLIGTYIARLTAVPVPCSPPEKRHPGALLWTILLNIFQSHLNRWSMHDGECDMQPDNDINPGRMLFIRSKPPYCFAFILNGIYCREATVIDVDLQIMIIAKL